MPKVSVIMPSLNVMQYINECVDSVINQTLKDIEIICVDAGSTDGTLEELHRYAETDSRLKVIISEKKSYGHQMNLGIKAASGKYIGIVETDDYVPEHMYKRLCDVAKEKDVQIVKANFSRFTGDGDERVFVPDNIVNRVEYYDCVLNPKDDPKLLTTGFYTTAGIYLREFLCKNEILYNESPGASYQDNGFFFQTFCCAEKVFFIEDNLYKIRRDNPCSSFHSKEKVYAMSNEYDFIYKFLCKDPIRKQRFSSAYWYMKYHNYCHTLNRVGFKYKLEFIKHFSNEFADAERTGDLSLDYISDKSENDVSVLMRIIENPEDYFYDKVCNNSYWLDSENKKQETANLRYMYKGRVYRTKKLKKEIKELRQSYEYRIGRYATLLPFSLFFFAQRAIRMLRYFKHNGLLETVKRLLEVIKKKDEADCIDRAAREINFLSFRESIAYLTDNINQFLIFIVAKDNIGRNLTREYADLLLLLGMETDLSAKVLNGGASRGYISVIDNGNVVYDELAPNKKELFLEYRGYEIRSPVWSNNHCISALVRKNGINFCADSRGLNIVAFDKNRDFIHSSLIDCTDGTPVFKNTTSKMMPKINANNALLQKLQDDSLIVDIPELAFNTPKAPWGETAIIIGDYSNKENYQDLAEKYGFKISTIPNGSAISNAEISRQHDMAYIFNGCAFTNNASGEKVFLMGHKDVIAGNFDITGLRHECGEFELLTIENDMIELSTDYFGYSKWFYYHANGTFAAATSFHLLVILLKTAGVKLKVNTDIVLPYFLRKYWYTSHLYTYSTFVEDIYYCPVDKDVIYNMAKDELSLNHTPFYYEQADVKEYNEKLYSDYLKKAKEELVGNMTAIFNHPEIDNVVIDITDGLDTRQNIAAFSLLPENLRGKARLHTIKRENTPKNTGINYVADFKTACGIANLLGMDFDDLQKEMRVFKYESNVMLNSEISSNFCTSFMYRNGNRLADSYATNVISINGGNGESNVGSGCYGMFSYDNENDFDKWYYKHEALYEDEDISAKDKASLSEILGSLQAKSLQDKLDLHYTHFRNSFHLKNKYKPSFSISAIHSISAYRAKKMMNHKQKDPFYSAQQDLIMIMSSTVANFPHLEEKQNKRYQISESVRITKNNFRSEGVNYSTDRYEESVLKRKSIYLPDEETYLSQLAKARELTGKCEFYDNEEMYIMLLRKAAELIPEISGHINEIVLLYNHSNNARVQTTSLLLHLYYLRSYVELPKHETHQ